MGGAQQVGGGEYKNFDGPWTVDQAADEQARLEREAPIALNQAPLSIRNDRDSFR